VTTLGKKEITVAAEVMTTNDYLKLHHKFITGRVTEVNGVQATVLPTTVTKDGTRILSDGPVVINTAWLREVPKKCDCGCGTPLPDLPYKNWSNPNGNGYASSYCILKEAKACFNCGGTHADHFNPTMHDYKCTCNFMALER
jgi:hypothetical protein